jgi:hypothetical protein
MQSGPLQSVTIVGFDHGFFGERDNDHSTKPRFFKASRTGFGVSSDKNNPMPSGNIGLAKRTPGGDRVSPPTGLSPDFLGLPGWWGAYP